MEYEQQFLFLCRNNPEEVFKLVTSMRETIAVLLSIKIPH